MIYSVRHFFYANQHGEPQLNNIICQTVTDIIVHHFIEY